MESGTAIAKMVICVMIMAAGGAGHYSGDWPAQMGCHGPTRWGAGRIGGMGRAGAENTDHVGVWPDDAAAPEEEPG